MWKQVALILSGMLIGCASAVAINTVSAQSFPANPQAQRWEQFCEIHPFTLPAEVEEATQRVRTYGAQGFELVDMENPEGWSRVVMCFKRPSQ